MTNQNHDGVTGTRRRRPASSPRAIFAATRENYLTARRLHDLAALEAKRTGDYRAVAAAASLWLVAMLAKDQYRTARREAIRAGVA